MKIFSILVITLLILNTNVAFALEDTCAQEPGTELTVSSGSYFICSFAAPGEIDAYRILVSKGDRVSVAVAVLAPFDERGETPTPRIKIIDPDGSLAASRRGFNGVFADATMDSDGLATIIATDDYRQNTLQYSVQINCTGYCGSDSLLNEDTYEDESLKLEASGQKSCNSIGNYYTCSFRAPGEMDVYRIPVSKGDRITVAVAVLAPFDERGETPTPRIKIIDPDGSLAVSRSGLNGVFDDATMDSDGLATIIVTDDYRQNTLQYSVQVNCTGYCESNSLIDGNANEEGLHLEISNQQLCDSIGNYYICSFRAPGEMDVYRIPVSKGDRVSVAVAVLAPFDDKGKTPTPEIKIIDPDGSLAVSRSGLNGVFDDATMDSDGLATIIVTDDYRQNTLKYSVQVNCTGYCGLESLLSGNAYDKGYEDGQKVNASNDISPVSKELDTCPLAQPVVSSGAYHICSFRAPGEMNAYRITVSKGDRVSVAVAVLAPFDDKGKTPTPRIRIIDPDGSLAVSRSDNNGVSTAATMDSDGLATIIVTDYNGQNTLQYSVQVNCTGTCTDSTDGDEYIAGYQDGLKEDALNPPSIPVEVTLQPIIKVSDDNLKIKIGFDSGNSEGINADWWLVAKTPTGLSSYDLNSDSWSPGINVTYQGALFSFKLVDFLDVSGLPRDTSTLYFGVDLLMNGLLDMEQAHYDSVVLNENSPPENSNSAFVWPVDDHNKITNMYATYNLIGNFKYHTGFDLTSSTGSRIIRAAASGKVRTIHNSTIGEDDDNHDMGNVIVIDHNSGKGPFTLYAHLDDENLVEDGSNVSAGDEIGKMGNTGCSDEKPSCGVHLHFEVKQWGVLGNLDDDMGPYWGYSPDTPPNLYGYVNPWPYFEYSIVQLNPTAVISTTNQIVRTGPNHSYEKVVGNIEKDDMYVAFANYDNWYQIYFPSIFGPATGWIQAIPEPNTTIKRVNDPVRGTIGVSICRTENACANTMDQMSYMWDQQWFVEIEQAPAQGGCSSPWVKTFLGSDAPQRTGWMCGEYVD